MKYFKADIQGRAVEFCAERIGTGQIKITRDGRASVLDIAKTGELRYSVISGQQSYAVDLFNAGENWQVFVDGSEAHFNLKDERAIRRKGAGSGLDSVSGQIASPMPGKVVDIKVKVGQKVTKGEGLVVVEAMKMQNEFKAPMDGVVKEVLVNKDDSVEGGRVMVVIE
ncbi:MAG: biotin/lipoyl-binding protein [Deltaproteobacteria bacterium]|nr:biotin/lipoyl-binding protein [Deltaproteobacteria bacterium]